MAIQIAREVQNEHCAYYVNGHMILIDLACSCSEWLVSDLLIYFSLRLKTVGLDTFVTNLHNAVNTVLITLTAI